MFSESRMGFQRSEKETFKHPVCLGRVRPPTTPKKLIKKAEIKATLGERHYKDCCMQPVSLKSVNVRGKKILKL